MLSSIRGALFETPREIFLNKFFLQNSNHFVAQNLKNLTIKTFFKVTEIFLRVPKTELISSNKFQQRKRQLLITR